MFVWYKDTKPTNNQVLQTDVKIVSIKLCDTNLKPV